MEKESKKVHEHHIDSVIHDMIKESKGTCKATEVFHAMDKDGSGSLGLEEFISVCKVASHHSSHLSELAFPRMQVSLI